MAPLPKLAPDTGDAYLLRARMAARRKDLPEARKLLKLGFENGGDDFDSRLLYAQILEKAGRADDAIAQYDAALRCWPTCSEPGAGSPFLNKARLLRQKGDKDAAASVIDEYARYNGKDYEAHVLLAGYYREKGDLHLELEHLERARDIDPFDRALHERLAELYMQRQKPDDAAFVLRICLAIRPEKDHSQRGGGDGDTGPKLELPKPEAPAPADEAAYAAGIRVKLAEALQAAGKIEEAKDAARKALEERARLDGDLVERAEKILK
jgi:tetratricopeptide (TPR) repeat protein